jgi:nucleotide-binding universal stress UspA family protein
MVARRREVIAMYGHILVPLDGSEFGETVLPHVEALANRFGSKVTILRVLRSEEAILAELASGFPQQPVIDPTPILNAEREDAEKYLEDVKERLVKQGLSVQAILAEGPAAGTILNQVKETKVDLIAMTTHGRTGLARVLLGSVADVMVRHAPCPVLLVRVQHAVEG